MRVQTGYRWLYLLVVLPTLSDLIETGGWPATRRAWITEVVIGVVILALVRHVRSVHAQLIALTHTDPLTGLRNRRGFVETVESDCLHSCRNFAPLSLVWIDLDNFKHVNDSAGHAVGDRLLRQLGEAITAVLRADIDRAFRLGGDEFALLLPGVDSFGSEELLEQIRGYCRSVDDAWANGTVSISAGIVEHQPPENPMTLVRRADVAMYHAKNSRKRRPASPLRALDAAHLEERIRA